MLDIIIVIGLKFLKIILVFLGLLLGVGIIIGACQFGMYIAPLLSINPHLSALCCLLLVISIGLVVGVGA